MGELEDKFCHKFCDIIRAPNSVVFEKEKPSEIIKKLQIIINSKTGSFWKKKFSKEKNVCCSLVERVENLFKDSHLVEKKLLFKSMSKSKVCSILFDASIR